MRILYLTASLSFPGIDAGFAHTYGMAKALQELGNDVFVVAKGSRHISNLDINFAVTHVDLELSSSLRPSSLSKTILNYYRYLGLVRSMIEKKRIEIVHERFAIPGGVGVASAFLAKIPSILEVNSPIIGEGWWWRWWSGHRYLQFHICDAIVTQTDKLKNILNDVTHTPVFVVPNGVDTEMFTPQAKDTIARRLHLNGKYIVTCVSSFRPWHGVEDLVSAAKIVTQYRNDVVFLVVGSGESYTTVKSELSKNNLTQKVILLGSQPYSVIPQILAASTILVAPLSPLKDIRRKSLYKKYGMWWSPVKIFEYLASGKPILSTQVGEIPEYIDNAGILYEEGDVESLASHILELLENPQKRRILGKYARERAVTLFSWKKQAEKLIKIYNSVQHTKKLMKIDRQNHLNQVCR